MNRLDRRSSDPKDFFRKIKTSFLVAMGFLVVFFTPWKNSFKNTNTFPQTRNEYSDNVNLAYADVPGGSGGTGGVLSSGTSGQQCGMDAGECGIGGTSGTGGTGGK